MTTPDVLIVKTGTLRISRERVLLELIDSALDLADDVDPVRWLGDRLPAHELPRALRILTAVQSTGEAEG